MKLSVVVPCYNEAKNIPLVLERFKKIMKIDAELILVDNNSKDNTKEVLKRELKKHKFARTVFQKKPGYGAAIRKGLESAKGEFLCWTHADLQTDPNDVLKAYNIIVSQEEPKRSYVKGERKGRPFSDQFFTTGMSIFESVYLGTRLHDINAQPNIFHSSFFKHIPRLPDDFSLDLYVLYVAKKRKLNVVRFPVLFTARIYGESSWNTSLKGKLKFIKRTIVFTLKLKKYLKQELKDESRRH